MSYIDDLSNLSDISFDKILKLAKDNVPALRKGTPWIGLNHGVKLLSNDDELAQYLVAYGAMHREKIYTALDTIINPREYFSRNITIIDWGCGQGLATMCFYDYMRNLGIEPSITQIILVEPSSFAIKRANTHLSKYTSTANVTCINKYINDVSSSDINVTKDNLVLHFFSNILDIESVDLDVLSSLVKENIQSEQVLFCVGPQNAGASRIDEFAKKFEIDEDDLIGEHKGNLSLRGTINLMVFRIKANIPEVIKVQYYRHRRTDLGNCTALNRILSEIPPTKTFTGKVLQFYRSAISLERMKSVNITDVFYYPFAIEETNKLKFNIDIQDNSEFELIFQRNSNRAATKWPKHLNIGLSILWDETIYRLIEYVYPYEDLKGIDITSQYVSVDLSMFTVSADVADKLELTDEVVEVINETLMSPETRLNDLESILKDAISHTVKLYPELSLTLTAEAPALSQISSELKNLTNKDDSTLMNAFLSGNIPNNVVDMVSEDDIINVVEMDCSQRKAITRALNSKVSVITGPPGTGKTQMIVNLLANAMLKGKSVLVASKNNKAVDNIKERFDQVDDYGYLLRFGSRELITSKLLPSLNSLIASIPNIQYDDAVLAKLISDYYFRCKSASDARGLLSELVKLTDSVPEYELQIQQLENGRKDIELDYKTNLEELHATNCDIIEISARKEYDWSLMLVGVQKHINTLEVSNRGLRKFLFNWFSKDKYAAQVLNDILSLPVEVKDWIENESGIKQVSDVKDCTNLLRLCQIELSYIRRINSYCQNLAKLKSRYAISISDVDNKLSDLKCKLDATNNRISILANDQDQLLSTIKESRELISSISGDLVSNLIKSRLVSSNTMQAIARYKNYLPDNIPWRDQDMSIFYAHAKEFIDSFRLNSVTSLSVKSAYPLKSELFDIVIIDEASQCDVASALPLIYRAKQVVVIGDPMQLKHITSVTVPEEKVIKNHLTLNENPFIRYAEYSLWDYCHDLITTASVNNTQIVLDSHYRCHPQIIGYSNEMFYQRRLGTTLKVCTIDTNCELRCKGIIWVDVIGSQKSKTRNINEAEVDKAISLAKDIAYQCPNVSIGIISPFKHQAEEINTRIPDELRERIVSDTVHKFQGDEKDVIIYSTVVTDNSPVSKIHWIDRTVPNLVNVAITRARTALYVVGNREYIRKHSDLRHPLGYLVDYTEHRASVTSTKTETIIIDTNVFVNCPDILDHIEPSKQVVISAKVIDELDKLKVTIEESKKRNVELALRNLNRIFNLRSIRMECADFDYLPVDFSRRNPDNMILSVALKFRNHNPVLITSDNGLKLKAKGLDIRTISFQSILNS